MFFYYSKKSCIFDMQVSEVTNKVRFLVCCLIVRSFKSFQCQSGTSLKLHTKVYVCSGSGDLAGVCGWQEIAKKVKESGKEYVRQRLSQSKEKAVPASKSGVKKARVIPLNDDDSGMRPEHNVQVLTLAPCPLLSGCCSALLVCQPQTAISPLIYPFTQVVLYPLTARGGLYLLSRSASAA